MAIDVGDAVLNFIGDTTQLDASFAKVGETAEASLAPAVRTLSQLNEELVANGQTALTAYEAQKQFGEQVELTSLQLIEAQREATGFGTEAQVAAEKAGFSMREAKGEIALLGEEIGIQVPRHLRGFVAELPGVGAALNAAFSATAVLILLQLLVEGAQKLSEFVSHTFIFTAAQEEANKAIAEANKQLEDLSKQYETASDAVEKFGKNAVQLTAENTENLVKKQEESKQKLIELQKEYQGLREKVDAATTASGFFNVIENDTQSVFGKILTSLPVVGAAYTAYQVKKAKDAEGAAEVLKGNAENEINIEAAKQRTLAKQVEEARQLQAKADQDAYVVRENIAIASEAKLGAAVISFRQTQALFAVQLEANNETQIIAINQAAEEAKYELALHTLNRKLALLELERKDTTVVLNEIGDLRTKEFERNQVDINAVSKSIQTNLGTAVDGTSKKFLEFFTNIQAVVPALASAEEEAQKLGITYSGNVAKSLEDATVAYQKLAASGKATNLDLVSGALAVEKARLAEARETGVGIEKEIAAVEKLQQAYNRLTGAVVVSHNAHLKLSDIWKQGAPSAAQLTQDVKELATVGYDQLAKSAESAFAALIDGSATSITAVEKAVASTLAGIAAQAAVYALFYLGRGLAESTTNPAAAALDFHASAVMGETALVAGAAAVGLSFADGSRSGGASGAKTPNTVSGNQNEALSPTAQTAAPVVQRFATGGLVTGPTLAVLGETAATSREAAIPLDDPQAVAAIVKALGGGKEGAHVIHNWQVRGLVSPDTLSKVMKDMTRAGSRGQGRLTSTNSSRLTRKV